MTYSNDPKWRKFMDAKWKEMEQNKIKPSASDLLISSAPLNYIKTEKKGIKRDPKVPAPRKASPKVPPQRLDYKAARSKPIGSRTISVSRDTEVVKKKPTIAEMGARRREIGAKKEASVDELKEYRDLSNKIEHELTERQKKLNEDWTKG
tara:strand:+ start:90 stop:539 length:450 start_codon:yes stop_codon:yes gene_type:complete